MAEEQPLKFGLKRKHNENRSSTVDRGSSTISIHPNQTREDHYAVQHGQQYPSRQTELDEEASMLGQADLRNTSLGSRKRKPQEYAEVMEDEPEPEALQVPPWPDLEEAVAEAARSKNGQGANRPTRSMTKDRIESRTIPSSAKGLEERVTREMRNVGRIGVHDRANVSAASHSAPPVDGLDGQSRRMPSRRIQDKAIQQSADLAKALKENKTLEKDCQMKTQAALDAYHAQQEIQRKLDIYEKAYGPYEPQANELRRLGNINKGAIPARQLKLSTQDQANNFASLPAYRPPPPLTTATQQRKPTPQKEAGLSDVEVAHRLLQPPSELQTLREQHVTLQERFAQLQSSFDAQKEELEATESDVEKAKESNTNMRTGIEQLQKLLKETQEQREKETHAAEAENTRLTTLLEQSTQQLHEQGPPNQDDAIDRLQHDLSECEKLAEAQKQQLSGFNRKWPPIKQLMDDFRLDDTQALRSVVASSGGKDATIKALRNKADERDAAIETLTTNKQKLEAEIQQVKQDLQNKQAQLNAAQSAPSCSKKNGDQAEEISKLSQKINGQKRALQVLEDRYQKRIAHLAQCKAELRKNGVVVPKPGKLMEYSSWNDTKSAEEVVDDFRGGR